MPRGRASARAQGSAGPEGARPSVAAGVGLLAAASRRQAAAGLVDALRHAARGPACLGAGTPPPSRPWGPASRGHSGKPLAARETEREDLIAAKNAGPPI